MPFKDISYLKLWQPGCMAEQTIKAIMVEGIKWNISVKLFCIWTRAVHMISRVFVGV